MPKLVFLQDIPLRGDDLVDRTYEYGSDKNFNATYSVVNIYDLQNNIILCHKVLIFGLKPSLLISFSIIL